MNYLKNSIVILLILLSQSSCSQSYDKETNAINNLINRICATENLKKESFTDKTSFHCVLNVIDENLYFVDIILNNRTPKVSEIQPNHSATIRKFDTYIYVQKYEDTNSIYNEKPQSFFVPDSPFISKFLITCIDDKFIYLKISNYLDPSENMSEDDSLKF